MTMSAGVHGTTTCPGNASPVQRLPSTHRAPGPWQGNEKAPIQSETPGQSLDHWCAASPGARAYYDQQRNRGIGHHAALRQLGNRLVGILHGCLKTGTAYDEAAAWQHREQHDQKAAA